MNDYELFAVVAFDEATIGQYPLPSMGMRFALMWEMMELNLLLAIWGVE